jgi:hypothetical protein
MDLNLWTAGKNYLKGEYAKVRIIRSCLDLFFRMVFRPSADKRGDAIPAEPRRTHGGRKEEFG